MGARVARKFNGRSARRKGLGFEREIAEILREFYPDARRQLEYHQADCAGTDLMNTGHYRIQCKRKKTYVSLRAIEEVVCDEDIAGEVPVLIAKADRGRTLVALPFEEFLRLLRDSRRSQDVR
jgi:hypothetical protein